ncbi:MAG: hypothetical protein LQ347_002903 [Umbilicaria vellea]|nr:MAG: hypothetical protein LQ347_002903 [Umbilicaria vellea]
MPAPKPILEEADVQPWRWRGYPSFAKWMASDNDFLVLRRFGSLHARVALMLQDQLAWLEQELEKEDDACKRMPKGHSGTFRFESQWRRQRILGAVTFTLQKYNHFVLEYSQQKALPDASTHQVENVKNWMNNANGQIIDKEAEFINHEGDLMAVVAHEKTPLRRLMDRYDIFDYFRCCQTGLDKRTYDQFSTTVTTNEAFIHQYARFFTIVIGLVFIIAPFWSSPLLTAVQDSLQIRLVIVTWLVVLFGVFMAIGTLATPFNTVGIITVYAAWLAMIMRLSL